MKIKDLQVVREEKGQQCPEERDYANQELMANSKTSLSRVCNKFMHNTLFPRMSVANNKLVRACI